MTIEEFWINVDTPEKSRRVQEIVIAAGYGWGTWRNKLQYMDRPWLHFMLWDGEPEPVLTHATSSPSGATISYDDFVAKYGHILTPCSTGEEEEYDG